MARREKDYLDELIQDSVDHDPGFAEAWAPFDLMGRLIGERTRLGLSQKDVAERMGTAQSAVARMENRPDGVSLLRILAYAKALGVEFVMKPSPEKPKNPSLSRGRPVGSRAKAA